jgi:hypothetical protein
MSYLYVDPALRHGGLLHDPRLPQFTERHHFRLPPIELAEIGTIERRIDNGETLGVIFGLGSGLPNKRALALARYALRHRKSASFIGRLRMPSRFSTVSGSAAFTATGSRISWECAY